MPQKHHISVCVCSYKRVEMLKTLLSKLEGQETEAVFDYSIVVVDNDKSESARHIVESFARQSKIAITYYVEPEQNISLARNKTIENAQGDFVALIDDDEFPNQDWLLKLYKALYEFRADGVLGPVKPYFEIDPPRWVVRGKLLESDSRSFPTGTIIPKPRYTKTGNVIINRELFVNKENLFDPLFGKIGGEDFDFFKRMMQKGHSFVWCNEAIVNEIIPPQRFQRSYFLKRALLEGIAGSRKISFFNFSTLKSLLAITFYTPILPLLLLRHDVFMVYLIKDCIHIGKILALLGLELVKERTW